VRTPGSLAMAPCAVPSYLLEAYWWAYVDPRGVRVFERQWLVNLILCGNYARLRDAALDELGAPLAGRTLQIACVYGDLTQRLAARLAGDGEPHVVDVLPVQLANLARKLGRRERVELRLADAAALGAPDASYDRALLFFLLHEQPEAVRRATLAEALRVVRPGGKVVVIDYHRPSRWHPLGSILLPLIARFEPYAPDLWRNELVEWLPPGGARRASRQTYFGGLYQKLVLTV
jgi:ubiquinone/menaquinone biosynthesis C-methylase UbiE